MIDPEGDSINERRGWPAVHTPRHWRALVDPAVLSGEYVNSPTGFESAARLESGRPYIRFAEPGTDAANGGLGSGLRYGGGPIRA